MVLARLDSGISTVVTSLTTMSRPGSRSVFATTTLTVWGEEPLSVRFPRMMFRPTHVAANPSATATTNDSRVFAFMAVPSTIRFAIFVSGHSLSFLAHHRSAANDLARRDGHPSLLSPCGQDVEPDVSPGSFDRDNDVGSGCGSIRARRESRATEVRRVQSAV